jgi:Leucine-rich repeat (LRR) protein
MKSHVSMFTLLSIVVSLTQPAWSMEGRPFETPHSAKRKRGEKSQSPEGDLQEDGKNSLVFVKTEDESGEENEEKKTSLKKKKVELTEIPDLSTYFDNGHLEINHDNYDTILNSCKLHKDDIRKYEGGVFIKDWKVSVGFKPLIELLEPFRNIKSFKLKIDWTHWDEEENLARLMRKTILLYENLETLDISNCRLTDENMREIMESIQYPEKLRVLDVSHNPLSIKVRKNLQDYFENLVSLGSSQD